MIKVKANRGNMCVISNPIESHLLTISSFICYYWLLRSEPYLKKQPIPDVHAVVVLYLGKGFSGYRKINHQVGDKIEELAGNNCFCSNDHIIWKWEALL